MRVNNIADDKHQSSTAFLPVSFLARLKERNSLLGCQREMTGDRDFSDLKQVLLLTYGLICEL
jgi:hypothetical protein